MSALFLNSISLLASWASFLFMGLCPAARGVIMREAKTAKIFLDQVGSFLGRGEGCLIVKDRKRKVEKNTLFEDRIGEVQIRIGNMVSSAALATCVFWGIDVLIATQRGNPVAVLKSLEDDSDADTRIGHAHYRLIGTETKFLMTAGMDNDRQRL